jgi:hypothetical protein
MHEKRREEQLDFFQLTFEKKALRRPLARVIKSVAPRPCQNKAWRRAHVKTKLGAAPMSTQLMSAKESAKTCLFI